MLLILLKVAIDLLDEANDTVLHTVTKNYRTNFTNIHIICILLKVDID